MLKPFGVITTIAPLFAPAGTTVWIWLSERTVKLAAFVRNLTLVAPVKFAPLIVTVVPTGPLAGLKLVITGGLPSTIRLVVLVALPAGVVTVIGPLVAPAGTCRFSWLSEIKPKLAV